MAADRRWYLDEPPPSARGYAAKWESTAGAPAIVVVPDVLDVADVPGDPDDHDGAGRRRRALAAVALAALLVVAGVIAAQLWPDARGDEAGPVAPTPTTAAVSTSTTASRADATPLAPAPTASTPSTTRAPASSVPPTVSTTEEPAPPPSGPPDTAPDPGGGPPGQGFVRQGSPCQQVGATAITANGTPVTCTTTDCNGDTDDQPRWWRTTC
jgi:hypothetical protein